MTSAMNFTTALASMLVIVATATPAVASSAESAKISTEDAFTVDRGAAEFQITYQNAKSGKSFDSGHDLVGRDRYSLTVLNGSVTYGITHRLDVAAGIEWAELFDDTELPRYGAGIGNAALRLKWTFSRRGEWGFAYLGGVTAPVGQKATESELCVAQDSWSFDQLAVATGSVGRVAMSADVGYRLPFWSDDPNTHGGASANAALGYQVADWIQPLVEVMIPP